MTQASFTELLDGDLRQLPLLLDLRAIQKIAPLSRDSVDRAVAARQLTPVVRRGCTRNSKRLFPRAQVLAWLGISDLLDREHELQQLAMPRRRGRPRKEVSR